MVAAWGPRCSNCRLDGSGGASLSDHTGAHGDRPANSSGLTRSSPPSKGGVDHGCGQGDAVGRKALEIYLNLANYLNSWKRLGFTDEDVAKPGSHRLVDAVVAYGTATP